VLLGELLLILPSLLNEALQLLDLPVVLVLEVSSLCRGHVIGALCCLLLQLLSQVFHLIVQFGDLGTLLVFDRLDADDLCSFGIGERRQGLLHID